ncbi:MAG: 2-hydroxy-3-oxopropionate reductase [Lachnospiraceae bacterium]|jgi:2-hydroxy-3-oxopropionate reductase|nr:2-hydroxy-3-oxopropionate reductase [Lachnospiraceae bacterium]
MKIGFIGMGIMGKPMAINLLKAGYEVMVNTRTKDKALEVIDKGAEYFESKQDLAREADVLLTMLPDGPDVEAVMLTGDGLASCMKKGSVFIDMSSINPEVSIKIARELEKRGVDMLDAPVSGGEPKAIDGTLSFMVGGKEEVFERCKDILLSMGSSATRCGMVGAGNTTKLSNQIVVAANIQAVAEALMLAKKAGVDPEVVYNAIKGGLAGSTVMDAKAPMMLSGNDKPGFKIDLHIKDLNNAIGCAHSVGAYIPMTAQVKEIMEWLRDNGHGGCDHSAIIKFYEHLMNTELKR